MGLIKGIKIIYHKFISFIGFGRFKFQPPRVVFFKKVDAIYHLTKDEAEKKLKIIIESYYWQKTKYYLKKGTILILVLAIILANLINDIKPKKTEAQTGYQWTPSGGSLVTGSEYPTQDNIANVPSYRALMSSDDSRWATKFNGASGLDKRASVDGVNLQGANKIIITYEGYVSDAAGVYKVQIYDRILGDWRTLNWRDANHVNTSEATYAYEIYDGYWQSGGTPISTPLANFISDDANKRVQVRVYSTVASAHLHYWDRLQVEVAIDPTYYANGLTKLNGWTGTVTNDYSWTNYADDQRMTAANQAGTPLDFYLSFKNIESYTNANSFFVDVQSAASNVALTYKLQIYKFNGAAWQDLSSVALANTTEASYYFSKSGVTLSDYLNAGEAQVRFVTASSNTYTLSIDRIYLTVGATTTDTGNCLVTFGAEAGGTTCANAASLDTSAAESTWQQATDKTAAAGYYPGDYAGTWNTHYSASSNINMPINIPASSAVTGIIYGARFRSNDTTIRMMPSLKDISGINPTVNGGWVDGPTYNAAVTYTVLEPISTSMIVSPEDFLDATNSRVNFRMRTSSSSAVAATTRDWDYGMVALRFLDDDTASAYNNQAVPTGGSLTTGSAVAVGATNTASYTGTFASDNYYWQNQNSASGLDVKVNIDDVTLNNSNKMIITYEGASSNAALVYLVQIYDNSALTWRTLNDREVALANTTDATSYFTIFNGYWSSGSDPISTPLSNFITADADKRVQLRIYSYYTGTAYTHSIDRFQLELANDPVYFANDYYQTNASDGMIDDIAASQSVWGMAKDSNFMYLVGGDDTPNWRIEKRYLTSGALDYSFGTSGVVTGVAASNVAYAIAIDATYMYVAGDNSSGNFRIEKRRLDTGALETAFDTDGIVDGASASEIAYAIALNGSYIYVAGYNDSGNFRIEKRAISDGALDLGFDGDGIVDGAAASEKVHAIAVSGSYLFVVGKNNSTNFRIEKRAISDGALDLGFDGDGIVDGAVASDEAKAIAVSGSYIYVAGYDNVPNWRIEKRAISDGALDLGFSGDGIVDGVSSSLWAEEIATDATYLYVVGENESWDFHIEKLALSDGAFDAGFDGDGIIEGDSNSSSANAIVVDSSYLYLAGENNSGDWRVSKRAISNGVLDTASGSGFGYVTANSYKYTHPTAALAITTGGSDDNYLIVNNPAGASMDFYFTFGNVKTYSGANAILVYFETKTSSASMTYKPKIYNFQTTLWGDLTASTLNNTSDTAYQVVKAPITTISDYVRNGEFRISFSTATTNAADFSVDYVYATLGTVIDEVGDAAITFGTTDSSSALNTQSLDTSSGSPDLYGINTATTSSSMYANDYAAGWYDTNAQMAAANINLHLVPPNDTAVSAIRYASRYRSNSTLLTVQPGLLDYSGLLGTVGGWLAAGTTNALTTYTFSEGFHQATNNNAWAYNNDIQNMRLRSTASTLGSSVAMGWDFAFESMRWHETERIVTVGTEGTQVANLGIPSSNGYVGGAFTFTRDYSSANITSITVADTGTVSANANLSNLDLYYETAGTCTYNGDETLFGTAASFNASEKATVTGTMSVGASKVCVYPVLDVGAGASPAQTVELQITNPSTDVLVSSGVVSPATPVAISGTTTLISASNNPPANPATPAQKKTTDVVISTGGWTNEGPTGATSVKYTATVTDPDSDQVKLCVEKDTILTDFSDTEDLCGDLVDSGDEASVTIPNQADDSEYHWQTRAKDAIGDYSSWISYGGNSDGAPPGTPADRDYGIDTSAPTGGTVHDGPVEVGEQDWNDGSLNILQSHWSDFDATVSGLSKYEYAVRRSSDDWYWNTTGPQWQSGAAWYDNSTTDNKTVTPIYLNTGENYYFSVRAVDNAGSTSSPISSNGQGVSPTLSFSYSSNVINFANLNNANDWTDSQESTFTTSTNAASGYIIRGYITQLLTSLVNPSRTIQNYSYSGASWATPIEWPSGKCDDTPGSCGYGYTSNDNLVQSSDRFNASDPFHPYFAPYCQKPDPCYQTAFGDVVADHTNAVNGQTGAVSGEQFIVTSKVAVSRDQVASAYQSYTIFIVTANY